MWKSLFMTFVLVTASGCGGVKPVLVSKLTINHNSPMVAEKNYVPLEIVLDPKEVPNQFIANNDPSQPPIKIREVHAFIKRDLKNAFSEYFKEVRIVKAPSDSKRTVVAKVVIKNFGVKVDKAVSSSGHAAARAYGTMDWSIALRFSNREDYFFSYSDPVVGEYPATDSKDVPQMYKSVFEKALQNLFFTMTNQRTIIGIK